MMRFVRNVGVLVCWAAVMSAGEVVTPMPEADVPVSSLPADEYPDRVLLNAPVIPEDDAAFLGEGIFRPLKRLVPELGESLGLYDQYMVKYEHHPPAYLGGAFYGYDTDVGTRSLSLHADVLEYRFRYSWSGDWAWCLGFVSFGPGNDCSRQPTGASCFLVLRRSFNASPFEW